MDVYTSQVGWEYEIIYEEPHPSLQPDILEDPCRKNVLAKIVGGPVPKTGDDIWVEGHNSPLRIWQVGWIFRNGYPVLIRVYVANHE